MTVLSALGERLGPFGAWSEVLEFVRSPRRVIYYQAAMDVRPKRVWSRLVVRGARDYRVMVSPFGGGNDFDPFEADVSHLDRFWRVIGRV